MFLAGLSCAVAVSTGTVHTIPVDERNGLAIRIECPTGWIVSGDGFEALERHDYVRATLTSAGAAGLRYTAVAETLDVALCPDPTHEEVPSDSTRPAPYTPVSHRFDPDAFARQIPVGEVYADLAVTGGAIPSSCMVHAWKPSNAPEEALARLRTGGARWRETEESLERYAFFARWGQRWRVRLVARKPIVPERLEEAFACLESLEFPLAPAVNRYVAVDAALAHLPAYMRPAAGEDLGCGCPYQVQVDSLGTGYRVEFQVLDGTTARRVVRTRSYEVARDGTVTEWRR